MPKTLGAPPTQRSRRIVVIPCPYCSPDPAGPKYEQYCRQSLMQHKCFRQMNNLLADSESYVDAYAAFPQSGLVPPRLEDDVYRLLQQTSHDSEERSDTEVRFYVHILCHACFLFFTLVIPTFTVLPHLLQEQENDQHNTLPSRPLEKWMLICQCNADLQLTTDPHEDIDWTQAAPKVEEAPSFISQQQLVAGQHVFTTTADPLNLQGSSYLCPATPDSPQTTTTEDDCLKHSW